ncbi:MAG TPA: lantibiotic dehydratase, partial [Herpetosiphonaceae bacterium]
ETFESITGAGATRAHGRAYAGRTLVYEDCLRDSRLSIGPALLDALAGPLELLMLSARWFTDEIARGYRAAFADLFEQLADGGDRVDLLAFAAKATPLLRREDSAPVVAATAGFQARWAEALALPDDQRTCAYRAAELRARIAGLFAAEHAGWPAARYLAPDVLVCAGGSQPGSVRDDEFLLALGELHLYNTLAISCLMAQSPPGAAAELAAFLPCQSVLPVTQAEHTVQRTAPVSLAPGDYVCVATDTPSGQPAERTLLLAELEVVNAGGELVVRTRDGRQIGDLIAFFEMFLVHQCRALPGLGAARHAPRVVIDDVVVWRETWRLEAAELAELGAGGDGERMAAARRLMRRRGLPRHLFVRAPGEGKPLFLDFEAPATLRGIGKLARAAQRAGAADAVFVCSEMLPAFDDLWLRDAAGSRYTSELRLALADPQPYPGTC